MAKQVQKRAAKDYPAQGIKKGDMYWFAEVMTGPRSSRTIRSKTRIPRSQLTASDFLATAYNLSDQLVRSNDSDSLESIKDEFETLRDETKERLDNMPEGLQQGPTGETLQERIDQIDSLIEEIEQNITAIEELEENDLWDDLSDDQKSEKIAEALSEYNNLF